MNVGQQKKVFDLKEHPYVPLDNETIKALEKQTEENKLKLPHYKALDSNKKVWKSAFADKIDLDNNIRVAKILADHLKTNIYIRPHVNMEGVFTGIGKKK